MGATRPTATPRSPRRPRPQLAPVRARSRVAVLAAVLAAALTAAGGCESQYGLDAGLQSFRVKLVADEALPLGSPTDRLPFVSGKPCGGNADCDDGQSCIDEECHVKVVLDVQALGRDGGPYPYTGMVHVRITPGKVAPSSSWQLVKKGKAKGIEVYLNRAIGETNIWVEQDGFFPKTGKYGQCNDGVDNDGNGLVDLADPGCASVDDDQEAKPTLATGATQTLWFANPRIRDVQLTNELHHSPLEGQQVSIDAGRLVVINVVANGFYAVDLDDQTPDRLYNAIFVFTYSKPKFIDYGDILCRFSGGLEEHVGMTQLTFPSYDDLYEGSDACNSKTPGLDVTIKPPAPTDVTPDLVTELGNSGVEHLTNVYANSRLLEKYEANLVTFSDVAVATRWIACDKNRNALIDKGEEAGCRTECQTDPNCADLEGFFEYSQWSGITGGKKKVYGSVGLAEKFLPIALDYLGQPDKNGVCTVEETEKGFLQYNCPERTVARMTGSLRHIYLCGDNTDETKCDLQFWVIDPRYDGDIVLDPTLDNDGDGTTGEDGDCDDNNTGVHPGAKEKPGNGVDDDCDGTIDEA